MKSIFQGCLCLYVLLLLLTGNVLSQNKSSAEDSCKASLPLESCRNNLCTKAATLLSLESPSDHQRLAPGGAHCYLVRVTAKRELIQVLVDQKGVDVTTTLCGPDHAPIVQIDTTSGAAGVEPVEFIATPGDYTLTVEASNSPGATSGDIDVTLGARRAPNATDQERINATRSFFDADIRRLDSSDSAQECAVKGFLAALPVFQQLHDERMEAQTRNYLAYSLDYLHRYQEALEFVLPARALWKKLNDPFGEAQALNNIGFAYAGSGEIELALEAFNSSLSLWRAARELTNNPEMFQVIDDEESIAITNLADLNNELGEYDKALNALKDLLPVSRRSKIDLALSNNLKNIGLVHYKKNEYKTAQDFFEDALKQVPNRDDNSSRGQKASILNSIAATKIKRGYYDQAASDLEAASKLYEAIRYRLGQAIIANSYGGLYFTKGGTENIRTSIGYFLKALTVLDGMEQPSPTAGTLYNLAKSQLALGMLVEAKASIEEAINHVETFRAKIGSDDLKQTFFADRYFYYELYIDLLMRMNAADPSAGYDRFALLASERARARRLLDLLNNAQAFKPEDKHPVPPNLLTAAGQLAAKMKSRRQLLTSSHTPEQAKDAEQLVLDAQRNYRQLQRELRHGELVSRLEAYPLNFDEVSSLLDPDTVALEYHLGQDRSFVWAISLRTKELLMAKDLGASRAEIENQVEALRKSLTARGCEVKHEAPDERENRIAKAERQFGPAAQSLADTLFPSTIEKYLATTRVVVIADGALQVIPFGVLPTPRGSSPKVEDKDLPFGISHEIVYLPSLTSLDELRFSAANRDRPGKSILAIADPVFSIADRRVSKKGPRGQDEAKLLRTRQPQVLRGTYQDLQCETAEGFKRLPATLREAQAIVARVPQLTGKKLAHSFDATLGLLQSSASDYRIIHLATHAFVPPKNPDRAAIVLSLVKRDGQAQSGMLRLKDIYQLKLRADLVTLSACETGIGEDIKGEGVVGLARAFMYAGVPRVVASLWKVDDDATRELMSNFYEAMLVENLSPAASLRTAQRKMYEHATKKKWKLPFYWSAFTIQGEWQ